MTKISSDIINQIRNLLDELDQREVDVIGSRPTPVKTPTKATKGPIGCSGAIQTLVSEGFLDELRSVQEIVSKLNEEGQPYSRELVSMNLLRLIKPPRRLLRRIKDQAKWKYIVRT